ncbi:MAG: hypothetical protein HYT97_07135 [Elusimicrobia bacterium]|nr:hypothetical protein [Elusimicrobiota bacterium]
MKKKLFFLTLFISLLFTHFTLFSADKEAASSAEAEKEKALKNPYPNDLGPDKIDISKYSAELQEGYKLMLDKCAKCHAPSRPLNSQFLDLKPEELQAVKSSNPEIFKDKLVWQVETGIWQRYIKRMMAKPGCNISAQEGKKIWKFIVEDSKKRKTGAQAKVWAEHRKKLLAEFKTKYPDRFKELFEK